MDQTLTRCLMARPKFDSPFAATAPAAPATFEFVDPQVVSRKEMAIAANRGYGRALAYAVPGKAHHTRSLSLPALLPFRHESFDTRATFDSANDRMSLQGEGFFGDARRAIALLPHMNNWSAGAVSESRSEVTRATFGAYALQTARP